MMKLLAASGLALVWAATAQAEPLSNEQQQLLPRQASAAGDLKTGLSASDIEVFADSTDDSVSLIASYNWDDATGDPAFNTASLKLSGSASSGEGSFLTDDGFPGGVGVELAYKRVWTRDLERTVPVERMRELRTRARELCVAKEVDAVEKEKCASKYDRALASYLEEGEARDLRSNTTVTAPLWLVGVSGGVGYQEFAFRNPLDLAERSTSRVPFSVSAYFGMTPAKSSVYWGAGVEYKESYADASERTLCSPAPTGGPQDCFTSAFAEPVKQTTASVFGVLRAQDSNLFPWPVGLEVKPAYDFNTEVFGIGARLYTFADKDKRLRGGLKLNWQTADNDAATSDDNFSIGVFVGTAFSVIPGQ